MFYTRYWLVCSMKMDKQLINRRWRPRVKKLAARKRSITWRPSPTRYRIYFLFYTVSRIRHSISPARLSEVLLADFVDHIMLLKHVLGHFTPFKLVHIGHKHRVCRHPSTQLSNFGLNPRSNLAYICELLWSLIVAFAHHRSPFESYVHAIVSFHHVLLTLALSALSSLVQLVNFVLHWHYRHLRNSVYIRFVCRYHHLSNLVYNHLVCRYGHFSKLVNYCSIGVIDIWQFGQPIRPHLSFHSRLCHLLLLT